MTVGQADPLKGCIPSRRVARVALVVALATGCSPPPPTTTTRAETTTGLSPLGEADLEALAIDLTTVGSLDAPPLFDKLSASGFAYYRFVNPEMTSLVCERYAEELATEPMVNLHGDAHLEQYAVAVDGRGLADFDASTPGKPLVDFIRFATSLWLAADARGLDATPAVHAFFVGYRKALGDLDFVAPEPRVAAQIRAGFRSPLEWMAHVETFIEPAPEEKAAVVERAHQAFVEVMNRQNPDLGPGFFQPKQFGALTMGIGSAREAKYLARVEGETNAPEDDVFLEAKQVPSHPISGCENIPDTTPASRIIEGQRRLSAGPQRFLGVLELDQRQFFIQAWRVNYTELAIAEITTAKDLAELAFDVGVQLGHGHPKDIGDPKKDALRPYLAKISERVESVVVTDSRELARLVDKAWRRSTRRP